MRDICCSYTTSGSSYTQGPQYMAYLRTLAPEYSKQGMPLSVLIIENEFIIAEDLRVALIQKGYSVFGIAYSYEQAIKLLATGRPDIALVDITMGKEQSGLTLGKLFSGSLHIPYIYVTSHADPYTLRQVELTSPNGFIIKPFERKSIYAALDKLASTILPHIK